MTASSANATVDRGSKDWDTCSFFHEKLVREQPYRLLYYPDFDIRDLGSPLFNTERAMEVKKDYIARVRASIEKDGMRNPLTIEWFDPKDGERGKVGRNPGWGVRIGNNRYMALLQMEKFQAPALVIVPDGIPAPGGTYEKLPFMNALALFDAAHPWWHSYILRKYRPDLVPPAA